jgi:hypothetical protein
MADTSDAESAVDAGSRFGERPLAQTMAAAAAMRRLTGLLLSLEHDHQTVEAMLTQFEDWEQQLAAAAPADANPRMADDPPDVGRVYLDHAFDIGAFNPCFPEYRFDYLDDETACGRVTFPLMYEGPPGLVHGGFLAVFFDCVTQQHSCARGVSGKTRSLSLSYRRPTPILRELTFQVGRSQAERGMELTARLMLDGAVLCTATVATVGVTAERLAGSRVGRRSTPPMRALEQPATTRRLDR